MPRALWLPILGLVGWLTTLSAAQAQYIGYVYPAGGQQGTTIQVRMGGQRIDGANDVVVTGDGVSAKLVHYYRYLSNQEVTLLREQLRVLKKEQATSNRAKPKANGKNKAKFVRSTPESKERQELIARLEARTQEWTNRPACRALSSVAVFEITIDPNAKPGPREVRLKTDLGLSNPMPFFVGQIPEVARKPMLMAKFQVLGKEAFSQRKRPPEEEEVQITLPCTMNGQIASGELNRYRFDAKKGQRLVASVEARSLVPYIADAVPGWFQPVVSVCDSDGNEVAYGDDFRFSPDPAFSFEVPKDGEYVLTITDALYRGREDFIYRITLGQVPYLTGIFPLGGRAGEVAKIEAEGWNLGNAQVKAPEKDAQPGIHWVTAKKGDAVTNRLPFVVDTLPEDLDHEPNNNPAKAQAVALPIIVNGRIDQSDDWDVFRIEGKAGETIVAEVMARRLASPVDSMLELTDSEGKVLAFNDDHEDPAVGLNTHHADSYLRATLPADGVHYVRLRDTARHGGPAYAYRLRISHPRPDFALRSVPSTVAFRSKKGAAVTVYAIRKDGFDGDIKLALRDPPQGFSAYNSTLKSDQEKVRLGMKTTLKSTDGPVSLILEGRARIGDQTVAHRVVPAEDRMQAFLWRHLLPAEDFPVVVFNPAVKPEPTRIAKAPKPEAKPAADPDAAPKFTKRQVAGRLRQLKLLFEEWLLTDDFYNEKVAECEAAL